MIDFIELQRQLRLNVVDIKFLKKDGTIRQMKATLRPDFIKKISGEALYEQDWFYKKTEQPYPSMLNVVDVDLMQWRRFSINKLIEVNGVQIS